MNNIVTLHADKRWKAVIEYRAEDGTKAVDHYFEEILDLHLIMERGPDWNLLVRCTVTLNRPDGGVERDGVERTFREERPRKR
jgi:hypothetical protein